METIRVLLYNAGLGGGGRERRTVQLIRGLDRESWIQQAVMTYTDKGIYPEIFETKVKIHVQEERENREIIFRNTEKIINDFKPDIVHVWNENPRDVLPFIKLKKKYNYKLIAGFVADGNKVGYFSKGFLFMQYFFWYADAIVSNSKVGLIAKHAPQKKSYYIPNGFDFARFEGLENPIALRKEFGSDEDTCIVSMCARFTKDKDWNSFLQIAKKSLDENLQVKFLAIGSGPLLDSYIAQSEKMELNNVLFLGQRTDVESILHASDVCMLLTTGAHQEGFSNSVLESMAAGLPTIATKTGGTPEIINEGETGFMVPVEDWEAAFSILKKLINDKELKVEVGNRAKKEVETNYTLDKMTERHIELYKTLLK